MRSAVFVLSLTFASVSPAAAADSPLKQQQWTVNGQPRTALISAPAPAATAAPVIFAFHGHGGSAARAAAKWNYTKHWPEAIAIYMQGLPTPTRIDPQGKDAGWQLTAGQQNDRDLAFFDAVLESVKKEHNVDPHRIYVTGHSNGGGFTYLLWGARGGVFAAVAPSAAAVRNPGRYPGLPALHLAGAKDQTVLFGNQMRMMELVRASNGCQSEGKPWAKAGPLVGTIYPSQTDTPFVSLIHPGGHVFPDAAPELIVKFFKEHAKK